MMRHWLYDDGSGYCFGGSFVLELAATNDIVAGKAASQFDFISNVELDPPYY